MALDLLCIGVGVQMPIGVANGLTEMRSRGPERALTAIRACGARVLFLRQYSPDLNPIEMAFAKLKAHLRAAAARLPDTLTQALGRMCGLFEPTECHNYFRAAGYASD